MTFFTGTYARQQAKIRLPTTPQRSTASNVVKQAEAEREVYTCTLCNLVLGQVVQTAASRREKNPEPASKHYGAITCPLWLFIHSFIHFKVIEPIMTI